MISASNANRHLICILIAGLFALLSCTESFASETSEAKSKSNEKKSTSKPSGRRSLGPSTGNNPSGLMYQWLLASPAQCVDAKAGDFPGGMINYGPHGETQASVAAPPLPGKRWPILLPASPVTASEKTAAWLREIDRVSNYSKPEVGSATLTPAMTAVVMGSTGQMVADQLSSPQSAIPRAREEQNTQNEQNADNFAAMERSQAGCAIDFISSFLSNFTVDGGNKWNDIRNRLFLPLAYLLLLPGAVLCQVKSVAAAGTAVLSDISPFEGLQRSLVAVFLIPATYLVVNYGIDLANAISSCISQSYSSTMNENMYSSAFCSHIRAFPVRQPAENKNYIPNKTAKMGPLSGNKTAIAEFEGNWVDVKLSDPCAGLNVVPEDRANEQVPYAVNAQRCAYNTFNGMMTMAWNVLCAFQMVYLYYLWFVGPVVAALWVYPSNQLRQALPSWIEGVVTVCLWSLFWNTTIMLMAAFRGVDDTGTLVMTALNCLAVGSVKFAFDFSGLVSDAAQTASTLAGQSSGSGSKGSRGKGASAKTAAGGHGLSHSQSHLHPHAHGSASAHAHDNHHLLSHGSHEQLSAGKKSQLHAETKSHGSDAQQARETSGVDSEHSSTKTGETARTEDRTTAQFMHTAAATPVSHAPVSPSVALPPRAHGSMSAKNGGHIVPLEGTQHADMPPLADVNAHSAKHEEQHHASAHSLKHEHQHHALASTDFTAMHSHLAFDAGAHVAAPLVNNMDSNIDGGAPSQLVNAIVSAGLPPATQQPVNDIASADSTGAANQSANATIVPPCDNGTTDQFVNATVSGSLPPMANPFIADIVSDSAAASIIGTRSLPPMADPFMQDRTSDTSAAANSSVYGTPSQSSASAADQLADATTYSSAVPGADQSFNSAPCPNYGGAGERLLDATTSSAVLPASNAIPSHGSAHTAGETFIATAFHSPAVSEHVINGKMSANSQPVSFQMDSAFGGFAGSSTATSNLTSADNFIAYPINQATNLQTSNVLHSKGSCTSDSPTATYSQSSNAASNNVISIGGNTTMLEKSNHPASMQIEPNTVTIAEHHQARESRNFHGTESQSAQTDTSQRVIAQAMVTAIPAPSRQQMSPARSGNYRHINSMTRREMSKGTADWARTENGAAHHKSSTIPQQ